MDNQLGRNIQYLRKLSGETQEELGKVFYLAKNTISEYESGRRKPDFEIISKIAQHYGVTTDMLLNTDLSELSQLNLDFNDVSQIMEYFNAVFPLFYSDKALENKNFSKGYELAQELLHGLSTNAIMPVSTIVRILEAFLTAIIEDFLIEAIANLIWGMFLYWLMQSDTDMLLKLRSKQLSKKLDAKTVMTMLGEETQETKDNRRKTIADFDELLVSCLKELKNTPSWSDLADYYLALRYIFNFIDSELSKEENYHVGIQMMVSFMTLDNKYAIRFLEFYLQKEK